jgi:hypothetical protein
VIGGPFQLVHDLSEVIAGLGGLPEGKAVGVEVIGHVTYTSTCLVNIALRPAPGASSQRIYSRAGEGAAPPAPDLKVAAPAWLRRCSGLSIRLRGRLCSGEQHLVHLGPWSG